MDAILAGNINADPGNDLSRVAGRCAREEGDEIASRRVREEPRNSSRTTASRVLFDELQIQSVIRRTLLVERTSRTKCSSPLLVGMRDNRYVT